MKYYHCSKDYYRNNTIISKPYKFNEDIIKIYKDVTGMDISRLIYLLDYIDEDYLHTFKYCYEVKPIGKVFKGCLDYSPSMCEDALNMNKNKFTKEELIGIIKLFANAYNHNIKSKETLNDLGIYGTIYTKYEYICNSAEIICKVNKNESLNDIYYQMMKLED